MPGETENAVWSSRNLAAGQIDPGYPRRKWGKGKADLFFRWVRSASPPVFLKVPLFPLLPPLGSPSVLSVIRGSVEGLCPRSRKLNSPSRFATSVPKCLSF